MSLLSGWKDSRITSIPVYALLRDENDSVFRSGGFSESICSPVVAISDEIEQWARNRQTRAGGYALVKSTFLTGQLAELRSEQLRAFRRTKTILKQIQHLGFEQKRLLSLIRRQATTPDEEPHI